MLGAERKYEIDPGCKICMLLILVLWISEQTGIHGERVTHEIERKPSFSDQDDILPPVSLLSHQRSFVYDDMMDLKKGEKLLYNTYNWNRASLVFEW